MVLGIAGNIAINPEFDLTSAIVGGVFITFIPIGLGIYCVKRARKSRRTLEPPPVPPIDVTVPEEIPPAIAFPEATLSVTQVEKICVLCGKQIAFHEESYILNCQNVCKHCYETEGSWLDVVLNENPNLTSEELWEKKKEVGERPFKTADEQGKRSARSKIWALGQVVAGSLILASEVWFWILLFSGNFAVIGGLSLQNLLPLVVETPVAIFVAICMIVGGASGLRSDNNQSAKKEAVQE